jgi:SAM-dependent methyltransferase
MAIKFFNRLLGKPDHEASAADRYRDSIDQVQFQSVHDKFIDVDPYPGFSKYLDFDRWIKTAQSHYDLLQIPANQKISMLDIGTGAGYFPFVCQQNGHQVMTVDVPGHDFYTEMVDLLGVNRQELFVRANVPLPDFSRRFDLITAFAICFNNHATEDLWGTAEWDFFIQDLSANQLTENGRLFMKFNPEPSGEFFNGELRELFTTYGAEIKNSIVSVPRQAPTA